MFDYALQSRRWVEEKQRHRVTYGKTTLFLHAYELTKVSGSLTEANVRGHKVVSFVRANSKTAGF